MLDVSVINIKFFEEKKTFDLLGQRPLKAALGGSTKLQRLENKVFKISISTKTYLFQAKLCSNRSSKNFDKVTFKISSSLLRKFILKLVEDRLHWPW